jgi:hypothetical protein
MTYELNRMPSRGMSGSSKDKNKISIYDPYRCFLNAVTFIPLIEKSDRIPELAIPISVTYS